MAKSDGSRSQLLRVGSQCLNENLNLRTKRLTLKILSFMCAKVLNESGERTMTLYGYGRVSTDGQTLIAQESALRASGCAKVYAEKVSGAKTDRTELGKLLKR